MATDAAKAGHRRRAARRRETLKAQGVSTATVMAPVACHPLLKEAASRMRSGEDPQAALLAVARANDLQRDESLTRELAALKAELAAAHAQQAESDAEASDAAELIDRLASNVGGWKRRAKEAEEILSKARGARGILPSIARYMLGI